MTTTHKVSPQRETVSLGKFAKYVARTVLKFMEVISILLPERSL